MEIGPWSVEKGNPHIASYPASLIVPPFRAALAHDLLRLALPAPPRYNARMIEYVVSACLAGCHCRYDGGTTPDERVLALIQQGRALPLCPEQMGGLPTPRPPFELRHGKAVDRDGNEVTPAILRGVDEAMRLVQLAGCTGAILKSRSPSCGFGLIYDGTFSGVRIPGNGIFADRLLRAGIQIWADTSLDTNVIL